MLVDAGSAAPDVGLLEREHEQERIGEALLSARAGRGGLVVVEGDAGIGKSRLLSDARDRAGAAGMRVLAVSGLELEADFAFGLALRLIEPALNGVDAAGRQQLFSGSAAPSAELFAGRLVAGAGTGVDHGYALVHALRTLTLRLAATLRGGGVGGGRR